MKRPLMTLGPVLALCAFTVVALLLWLLLEKEKGDDLLESTARLEAQAHELQSEAMRERRTRRPEPRPSKSEPPVPTPPPVTPPPHEPGLQLTDEQRKDFRRWIRSEQRLRILGRNAELIQSMSVPAEAFGKFKEILVSLAYLESDAAAIARETGVSPNSPAFRELIRSLTTEFENEMIGLLGRDEFARFRDLQTAEAYRKNWVQEEIGGRMVDAGVAFPLDAQSRLARVLVDVNRTAVASTPPRLDPLTGLAPAQQQTLSRAAEFLDRQQVDILRQHFLDNNRAAVAAGIK